MIIHWYYKTFVKWGDEEFSVKTQRWWLHRLWMYTIGLPYMINLLWIWYGPNWRR